MRGVAVVLSTVAFASGCVTTAPGPTRTMSRVGAKTSARCQTYRRTLSLPGRSGYRPAVAASRTAYGVVFEDSSDTHRGVHFQSLDAQAKPLSASVEVADLAQGGSEPRLAAIGDDFLVVWTIRQGESSAIVARRIDALGRPRSDVYELVRGTLVRALSLEPFEDGLLFSWTDSPESPGRQYLARIDSAGRLQKSATTAPIIVTTSPSVTPSLSVAAKRIFKRSARVAWVDMEDGIDRVRSATFSDAGMSDRVSIGDGASPSIPMAGVIYESLVDGTVQLSANDDPKPKKLVDGHSPATASSDDETLICYVTVGNGESTSPDELRCARLNGTRLEDMQIAQRAPFGMLSVHLAQLAPKRYGAVVETESEEARLVVLTTLVCEDASASR